MFKKVIKTGWIILSYLMIGFFFLPSNISTIKKFARFYEYVTVPIVISNIAVLVVVTSTYLFLAESDKLFAWSWQSLIKWGDNPENKEEDPTTNEVTGDISGGTNIYIMPGQVKYVGIIYLTGFLAIVPYLAFLEEYIFRLGTTDWTNGLVRSLAFGMAHCVLAGVPIGVGLSLSLAGLWFTHCYFVGGLGFATLNHTTYNAIAIVAAIIVAILTSINKKES